MLSFPILFPKRRHRNRQTAPPPIGPSGLLVASVEVDPMVNTNLTITFNGNVAWDGSSVPAAFKAYTEDGLMDSCIGVLDHGSDWIEVEFNAGVDVGAAWEILSAMEGLAPMVAFPQSGVVG